MINSSKKNSDSSLPASMILNDKTSPRSRLASKCSSSSPLIQNGTSRLKSQPNGCLSYRSRQQPAPSKRASNNEHTLSILAAGGGLSLMINAAAGRSQVSDNVANKQPTKLLFKKRRAEFFNLDHSRRPRIIQFGGSVSFVLLLFYLAVALIGLHVPLEATCKSIETTKPETGVVLGGNSLLNNDNINHQHRNQSTTQETPQLLETSKSTTLADRIISLFYQTPTTPTPASTARETETEAETKATSAEKEQEEEEEEENNGSSAGRDDDDAESCKGISADGPAQAANLTDNERLVNLQSCFQRKIGRQLKSAARSGMEVFEKLSLSGGCSSSLMALTGALGQLKAFAFKFLDASAKIPSGMMYGLLSDYGDFDQCMAIRSNKAVSLEDEAEEGAYSGKYCLMSLKLNYHVRLAANETAPEGIIEDGILWDELVRQYWTSKISKGFQVAVCFPSRCTNDDLNQLFQHLATSFNMVGEIISCQDGLDLKRQYQPDLLQRAILHIFSALLGLTLIGTVFDKCWLGQQKRASAKSSGYCELAIKVLVCFSLAKNWTRFMRGHYGSQFLRQQQQRSSHFTWSHPDDDLVEIEKSTTRSITGRTSIINSSSSATSSSDPVDYIDLDPESPSLASRTTTQPMASDNNKLAQPLTVRIDHSCTESGSGSGSRPLALQVMSEKRPIAEPLAHLSGLKLLIIIWITVGYSFLYPSANNYQYYRSIIRINFTRDSVWFATTNFTLGIDMLLYITGLLFVYKLLQVKPGRQLATNEQHPSCVVSRATERGEDNEIGVLRLISKKALRFWPTYLTVIGLAIVVPLISDGPMWPEMVSKKLGESCRHNWWANLLFINNYLGQANICLPSSWFVSILMQLFLIGSIIIVLVRKVSLEAGVATLTGLLISSAVVSFCFAYLSKVRAPVIKMDESFVMDLDENIFHLYTNIFNNLGPFLVGMSGGLLLINRPTINRRATKLSSPNHQIEQTSKTTSNPTKLWLLVWLWEVSIGFAVATIAVLVLSSVFHENYCQLTSAIYWSLHRIGWAIVTGYIIHQCATGKWKLLSDLLSLSAFAPLSRLIFIAYLVYPIFIHIHTGLVRDGLHVSIYNMLNIYITRLVMTFVTALAIHLLVELPFSTIEQTLYFGQWIDSHHKGELSDSDGKRATNKANSDSRLYPLLVVAPNCQNIIFGHDNNDTSAMENEQQATSRHGGLQQVNNNSFDKLIPAEETQ